MRHSACMTMLAAAATACCGSHTSIKPGVPWHDTDGNLVDAHGAGILEHAGVFYWCVVPVAHP